jgi:hypothetical protein
MELYQVIIVAIALANLAVTLWLLWLLFPIWRALKEVVFALDNFNFEKLVQQFLDEKPLAESVVLRTSSNEREGYKEVTIIKSYRRPLDPKEIQENFVRRMAQEMQ